VRIARGRLSYPLLDEIANRRLRRDRLHRQPRRRGPRSPRPATGTGARSQHKLASTADRLGGLDTRVADVTDPASIHALVKRDDVLLSTVGPFDRWGRPALDAAIDNGARYLDSTGE
jgi:hypothetical protein